LSSFSGETQRKPLINLVPGLTLQWLMGCLHHPANVQQTSSKCIQNARVNAGRLLDVYWIV